jgi:hypothetical protein
MESLRQIISSMPIRIDSTQDSIAVREWWKDAEAVIRQVNSPLADRYSYLGSEVYPVSPFSNPVITAEEKAEVVAQNPSEAKALADFESEKRVYEQAIAKKLDVLKSELNSFLTSPK